MTRVLDCLKQGLDYKLGNNRVVVMLSPTEYNGVANLIAEFHHFECGEMSLKERRNESVERNNF